MVVKIGMVKVMVKELVVLDRFEVVGNMVGQIYPFIGSYQGLSVVLHPCRSFCSKACNCSLSFLISFNFRYGQKKRQ